MAQAKAKGNSVVTSQWEGNVLSIAVLGSGTVLFDRTKASGDNRDQAERHGWLQRIMDAAAIAAPTRALGTTEENWLAQLAAHKAAKYEAVKELAEYYEAGEVAWKRIGGGAGADSGLFFTALCEFRPKSTSEKLAAHVKSLDKDGLAALKAVPEIVDIMNRLRKERLAKVDTTSALAGLEALELHEFSNQQVEDESAE
jgi:hypothetical protein